MTTVSAGTTNQTNQNRHGKETLPPQTVRQIADKVYALFLQELKTENERRRLRQQSVRR